MADSGLVFDPITGLVAPDTEVIRASVAADWVKAFAATDQPPLNTDATTPAGQLIDSETAIIEDKNAQVLYLANMFNPAVADGRWQDALGCDYQLYLELNNIEHTKTKARHPRTNGIRERFHKTVLQEFYQVTFRKRLYLSLNELQADLDAWTDYYNNERTH